MNHVTVAHAKYGMKQSYSISSEHSARCGGGRATVSVVEAARSLRPSGVTRRHGVLIGVKIGNLITFEQQQQQRRSTQLAASPVRCHPSCHATH